MPGAVQVFVGVQDRAGAARERGEGVELEVALQDDAVGDVTAERLPDVPQSRRPDLTIRVLEIGALLEVLDAGGQASVAAEF